MNNIRHQTFGHELVNYDAFLDPLVRRLLQLDRSEYLPAHGLYSQLRQERRTRCEVLRVLDVRGISPEETDPVPGMESLAEVPWLGQVRTNEPDRHLDYLEVLSNRPGINWYWFAQSIAKERQAFPWLGAIPTAEHAAISFPYTKEIWDEVFEEAGRDEEKARQLFGDIVRRRQAFLDFWPRHRLTIVERHHQRLTAQRQEELEAQAKDVRQKAGRLLRFPDRSPATCRDTLPEDNLGNDPQNSCP